MGFVGKLFKYSSNREGGAKQVAPKETLVLQTIGENKKDGTKKEAKKKTKLVQSFV